MQAVMASSKTKGGDSTSVASVADQGEAAAPGLAPMDLLILSFNCAEHFIDVNAFAVHLLGALEREVGVLPELVVL